MATPATQPAPKISGALRAIFEVLEQSLEKRLQGRGAWTRQEVMLIFQHSLVDALHVGVERLGGGTDGADSNRR